MGGRGSASGKGKAGASSSRVRGYDEILADLSVNTSPAEVGFMINNLYTESATDAVDKVIGIKRNAEGYVVSGPSSFSYDGNYATVYKSLSDDKKKQIIAIIKRDSKLNRV